MRRTLHDPTTRGGKALQDWIRDERRSQLWIVDQIRRDGDRLHQTTVSAWIGGYLTPSTPYAVRLEELTGIPVRWWTEPLSQAHSRVARTG